MYFPGPPLRGREREISPADGLRSTANLDKRRPPPKRAPMPEYEIDAVNDWIRKRRTWKPENLDAGREVPQGLLDALFENANWAPTHGLTEPWRFKLYRGDARPKLAAALQQIYSDHTPAGDFRPDKHSKLGLAPLQSPVVIAICMQRQAGGKIPDIEEVAAVACAVQNMHLTAAAAGLGAKWSSPPICYLPAMNQFLGLSADDRCLGLFYLGWPKEGATVPVSPRGPAAAKVEEMT